MLLINFTGQLKVNLQQRARYGTKLPVGEQRQPQIVNTEKVGVLRAANLNHLSDERLMETSC